MLEYFLILPLAIFALLGAIIYYRNEKNKKKATIYILIFITILIISNINNDKCYKQEISKESKSNLEYYLNTFNLTFIGRPFPCKARQFRLQELRHIDNIRIIKNLYLEINKDNIISYEETHKLSIKTIFLHNLEKERNITNRRSQ